MSINTPLIIKKYENENLLAQMYKPNEDDNIINDFTEILDKIIVDIYLKDNVFIVDKDKLNFTDEEKAKFVKEKRIQILKEMINKDFSLNNYLNNEETSFKMTSCVKCNCLGIYEDNYYKHDHTEDEIYCEKCKHKQDDFVKIL